MSDEKTAQELVIIRRRSHDEEEHGHSGLWKIAYADFMTALMAFFLVMWLVNAANKKTLQQVATYFNPVRMTDQVTSKRGLNDLAGQETPSEGDEPDKPPSEGGKKEAAQEKESKDPKASSLNEQGLFRDPYGLLSELSEQAATFRRGEDKVPEGGSKNISSELYSGGDGFRDPFDPAFRELPARAEDIPSDLPVDDAQPGEAKPRVAAAVVAPAPVPVETPVEAKAPATQPEIEKSGAKAEKSAPDAAAQQAAATDAASKTRADASPGVVIDGPALGGPQRAGTMPRSVPAAPTAKVTQDAREISRAVETMIAEARGPVPKVDVKATPEGVLISLMDDARFGMFAVGSAKPQPELVAIMERIASMVQSHSGVVVVRGHTDGRAYRSKDYDNWRLSSARAHMAYYMLVRGGVTEKRFDRIEGHADRELRVPNDPNAASNRRIEILIKAVQS